MSSTPPMSDRRRFLAGAISSALGTAFTQGAETAGFTVEDQRPFRGQTRRLKITCGGGPVASLLFPTDYPTHFRLKPELHQVCTPGGVPVTGSHEFSFIHHQSIMCGHGRVQADGDERVIDFYRQLPFPDPDRADTWHTQSKNLFQLGPSGIQRVTEAGWRAADQVVIRLQLAWQTRERGREAGDTLALEERLYRISRRDQATIVDVFSQLKPAARPLTLHTENDHGYLGVRVHELINVESGGVMRDSEGRTNAIEHFRDAAGERRVPRWIDCTGRIGAATVGMTLMSHPGNVRNEWYAREFGLMIISAAQSEPVRVTADSPFEFGARFVAHDGLMSHATADALHAEFAAVTAAQLRASLAA